MPGSRLRDSAKHLPQKGSGRGSVGRAVASDSTGPRFEYSHRQILYWTFTVNCVAIWKDENKRKKRPGKGTFLITFAAEKLLIQLLRNLFLFSLQKWRRKKFNLEMKLTKKFIKMKTRTKCLFSVNSTKQAFFKGVSLANQGSEAQIQSQLSSESPWPDY